jgi:hypothetical protein
MGYDRQAAQSGPLGVWYTSTVIFKPLWLLTIIFTVGALALAIVAGEADIDDEAVRTGLWIASFVVAVLATFFAYLGTMSWARRRKRLWG